MRAGSRLLVGFAILLPLALLTGLDGLSRAYEKSHPALSRALNPYNSEARIREALDTLAGPENRADPEAIAEDLAVVARIAPVDARAYSLQGEQALRAGAETEARALFALALSISPTEINSLKRMIGLELGRGDLDAAVDKLGVLLARWPNRFDDFAMVFAPIMRTPDGYRAVFDDVASDPPWRRRLLGALAGTPETARLCYRLLRDLKKTQRPLEPKVIDRTITTLLENGSADLAYQAFVLTRLAGDSARLGYVTNSEMATNGGDTPFDWRLQRRAGLETRFLEKSEGSAGSEGLRIDFRGKPVKGDIVAQTLRLPAGRFRFSTSGTARDLKLPKGLTWTVTCAGASQPIAKMSVASGRYDARTESVDVAVPATDCETQHLVLATGVVAPSMRYRYEGRLILHRVEIRQADAG